MDVVGSTEMTQHLDHEDTLLIMDDALRKLAVPVESHNGHITRFMGDGFKAVFGDPVARENDPEKAICAGLEILDMSQSIANKLQEQWDIESFQVRIGINTGFAALGGYTEAEDTVMGRTVNLAARIESAALPGGLLISHNTYRHVRGVFTVEPQEPITAKGFPEPVPVYLVKAIKPRAFRVHTRGVEGIETRMVGRHDEQKFLQDALLTAMEEGEGHVVTITGEAGVGKSRLLYEFQNWIELLPELILFYQGRGRQEAQGLPYSLLRDLFAFRFQIMDDDSGEQARSKIEVGFREVFGKDGDGMMRAQIIGQLLGFDFSASPYLKGVLNDAEQLRNRGLIYLKEYFQILSQESLIVVLLEDIHWGDDSSLDAVNKLGELTPRLPFLIVCAARSVLFERRPFWGEGQAYHTLLELRPLSIRESRQLVAEILKLADKIPPELRELVVRGAEGNPFYLEELIKMLIEVGVVIPGEEFWYTEMDNLAKVDVPSTLAGVLQARLDSLPSHERTVLQQASVVGHLFWDRIVAYIQAEGGNGDDPQLIPVALASLRNRELVYRHEESAFVGTLEYIFKHDVLRDVTYESVLKRLRKTYHGLVADWLIANCGDRIGEFSGLIAEHFLLAGGKERACQYYIQAGEQALLTYANLEAEDHFRRALSLECTEIDKPELLEGLGESLTRQGQHEQAIQTWNEAIELNLGLVNLTSVARLYAKSSRAAWYIGDIPRGLEICLEGFKWIKDEPDSHEVAQLLHETGRAYCFNGMPDKASKYCQIALQMAERLEDIEVQADTLATLGLLPNQPPEEAIYALTRAVELADEGNFLNVGSRANLNLGIIRYENTGDIISAKEAYERSLTIAKRRGDLHDEILTSWTLLGLAFESSELSEIERWANSLEDRAEEIVATDMVKIVLLEHKAALLGLRGGFQRSLTLLSDGRTKAQECGDLRELANISIQIALTNLEVHWSGRAPIWQEVEEVLNELINLGETGITAKASGLCLLSIAKTFQGNHQEARQYLEAAKEVEFDYSPFWQSINISRATAHLAGAEGRWEESFAAYEDLIETFSQKGYRWEHAHTLCDWGDVYVSRGEPTDLEAARKLYNQSMEIYDDVGAAWYKEQIEKRLDKVT
jgi:predicted ATPase/class 3 adenylate cyclase